MMLCVWNKPLMYIGVIKGSCTMYASHTKTLNIYIVHLTNLNCNMLTFLVLNKIVLLNIIYCHILLLLLKLPSYSMFSFEDGLSCSKNCFLNILLKTE